MLGILSRNNLEQTLLDHEHIIEGRSEADIVYELLLKLGLDLCIPMEWRSFSGKSVCSIGGGVLLAPFKLKSQSLKTYRVAGTRDYRLAQGACPRRGARLAFSATALSLTTRLKKAI